MRAEPDMPPPALLANLPHAYAERHLVLPLARTEAGVEVAVPPGADLAALDDLRFLYEAPIVPVEVAEPELRAAIARAYDGARSMADTMEAIEASEVADLHEALEELPDLLETGEEAPVIRLVNALLFEAARLGTSDVHVEPGERDLAVRFRIDGVLQRVLSPSRRFHAAIAARVKIMARLDIGERRLPQDGRFSVRIGTRVLDVRVSIVPTTFGERVVLRLLNRSSAQRDLPALGFDDVLLEPLGRLLQASHGLVLVTGPTGSGKTTTLYAALARLALEERNVMTIEDPVEYRLPGVSQMQVAPAIGLDFATGLRAVLRQDPDVVLVGEIRDRETAEIALQAALTGHLVLATLHTNDAATAVTRLLDMRLEPFLVASSVLGILAQRLVRRRCERCGGDSCTACGGRGLRGRTAIGELLVVDDAVRALVMERADAAALRRYARGRGMRSLRDHGAALAAAGVTTEGEVLRVTREDE
ncbi:MAG TPA: ATPase, T2SS/T4P/T4SS family, partial [Candidatus Limnocylindria bacterium]|nr:ATPase, T2SS/T4P/T4SS family [Candidatus Limnocylindria bacterium]